MASELTLFTVVAVAVVLDVQTGKISNRLILMGLISSLMFRVWNGGTSQIPIFLGNILVPVILLYLLFVFGALGAGDIKLFSVIGGFTNLTVVLHGIFWSFVTGAVFSVLKMLYHRNFVKSMAQAFSYVRGLLQGNMVAYPGKNEPQNRIHFSIAILIGLVLARIQTG